METSTLALGVGAVAVSEATGTTNLLGGGGGGGEDDSPSIPNFPSPDGGSPDFSGVFEAMADVTTGGGGGTTVVESASDSLGLSDVVEQFNTMQEMANGATETVEQTEDARAEIRQWWEQNAPSPDPTNPGGGDSPTPTRPDDGGGGGGGGGSDGYDLQEDYTGPASDIVRGGAEVMEEMGNVGGDATSAGTDFAGENPIFAGATGTGAALGSIIPGAGTAAGAATGAAVGGIGEVATDTVTGGTPLGVQSPINNDDDGAVWDGPDPLNLGRFTGNNGNDSNDSGGSSDRERSGDESGASDNDGGGGLLDMFVNEDATSNTSSDTPTSSVTRERSSDNTSKTESDTSSDSEKRSRSNDPVEQYKQSIRNPPEDDDDPTGGGGQAVRRAA